MALYIPQNILHLARSLYVRPETYGPTYVGQFPKELIKAGGRTIRYEIHKRVTFIWNKEELPEGRKESIIIHLYKMAIKEIVLFKEAFHFCRLRTKFYQTPCCQVLHNMQRKLLMIINVDFDKTG